MKIFLSSSGNNLENSVISEVFGRCSYFFIVDIENKKIKNIELTKNVVIDSTLSAGISTAKMVVEKDAEVVITGAIGPKALDILKQFNVQVYKGTGLMKEIIQNFIDKKLKII